jgi:lipoate-protein ligase A
MIIKDTKYQDIFGDRFELIDTESANGKENMKFDFERTMAVAEGKALPMFRLYSWDPWAISLGANQKEEEINKNEVNLRGWDLVRRPTGGRAVFHSEEITYSIVVNLEDKFSIHDVYKKIHILLLNALKKLGEKELGFEKSQKDFREFYKDKSLSASCFASSARYEIEFEGKKVVGSAQRLFGNTLLQHGSILIGNAHLRLSEVVEAENDFKRKKLFDFINSHSTCLENVFERSISYQEISKLIFEEIIG